jgi:hypothetical protein
MRLLGIRESIMNFFPIKRLFWRATLSLCLLPSACSLQKEPSPLTTKYTTQSCEQSKQGPANQDNHQVAYVLPDPSLNRLQEFFGPVLEANKKEFAGQGSAVKGFGAGTSYPQIWLRDSATIIPVSRFYYSREYLTSWLEEHLSYQRSDGQLYDWIASGRASNFVGGAPLAKEVYQATNNKTAENLVTISADKNTTEADQESSAVDAAYQVFEITGDRNWLSKKIKGRTVIERLNLSLQFLLTNRFDSAHGLIRNAFTADWGDVSPVHPDQRAIYLDKQTPSVAGIYTNSLFYRAAKQLEELNLALANESMAGYWRTKAAVIKENVNKHLWQADKGFYRIHLLLTPELLPDAVDDSNIFAMGGNAVAVLSGLANDAQARAIFDVAASRQREYGLSTIAGVLLPAYPKGFFKHPAAGEEYFYQNGGQWDWFAGRFLQAEFERGYSLRAYDQLVGVAKKAGDSNGLFEWNLKDGQGKGSGNYAGSAGALGGAIIQGLFGVYLSDDGLVLKPRLRELPGQIHLYEPATDRFITYQSCLDRTGTIRMSYESNVSRNGQIHILLPKNRQASELILDGRKTNFTIEALGEDRYVVFDTDWKTHTLQLKLAE